MTCVLQKQQKKRARESGVGVLGFLSEKCDPYDMARTRAQPLMQSTQRVTGSSPGHCLISLSEVLCFLWLSVSTSLQGPADCSLARRGFDAAATPGLLFAFTAADKL